MGKLSTKRIVYLDGLSCSIPFQLLHCVGGIRCRKCGRTDRAPRVQVRDELEGGAIVIESITGDGGRLSLQADDNCAGIAAKATLQLLGVTDVGISLTLEKGLPLGSGLGSSAASAAAAAWAVNALFGGVLTRAQLVEAGLVSEATVSGYHADNIAPAIMGGFVLVRSYNPLQLIPLQVRQLFELPWVLPQASSCFII